MPVADWASTAPHRRRRLGGEILLTSDSGGFAAVDRAGYREFLRGEIESGHRLWLKLQSAGLLRQYLDFGDLARAAAAGGLFAWQGPPRHRIYLELGGRSMELATLRRVLDYAFAAAPARIAVELVSPELARAWPRIWFAVEYGQRLAERSGRAFSTCARVDDASGLSSERAGFLAARRVALRLPVAVSGQPSPPSFPPGVLVRALCAVGPRAADPAGWAYALAAAGAESVRLEPEVRSGWGLAAFGRFYAEFLDALLVPRAAGPREEWTEGALSRVLRPAGEAWEDENTDLLGGLCYSPEGEVFPGSAALELDDAGRAAVSLGTAGETTFYDARALPVVAEILSAECADRQPLCSQCAYAPYCRPSPCAHLRDQGTLWGRTSSSAQCALALVRWDVLFERLRQEPLREILTSWLGSSTSAAEVNA